MSHELQMVLWVALAYIAARIVNNYVSVSKLFGPGV